MHRRRADAVQVIARRGIKLVSVLQLDQLRKPLHGPIGSPQVVGDSVEQVLHGVEARLQLRRSFLNLYFEFLRERAEARLTLAQRLLGPLALRIIPGHFGGADDSAPRMLYWGPGQ